MKQMSLIEMDGFLKGKCIPSDLKVNETNAEYLVRKFAEAEAKCAALAAENEEMKAGILQASENMEAHHDDYALFSYDADGEQMDALLRLCDAQDSIASLEDVKTPATDAFLAEVLAQGVEMFEQWCRGERDFTLIDEDVADAAAYEECVKRAEYFAAQLRKGGKQ